MAEITVVAAGIPAPQGSKRHVGNGRMVESSARVAPWRQDVRTAAEKALAERPEMALRTGPLAVEIAFYLPRPKGHFGTGRNRLQVRASAPDRPAGKPDVDKLARAVLDALTAVVWLDDAQVTDLAAHKFYAGFGGMTGAIIRVRELARETGEAR